MRNQTAFTVLMPALAGVLFLIPTGLSGQVTPTFGICIRTDLRAGAFANAMARDMDSCTALPTENTAVELRERVPALLGKLNGAAYEVSWHSIDTGGGQLASGGAFEVLGTVGQPDVGKEAGGDFSVTGGFMTVTAPLEGTCGSSSTIFCDGFESGNLSAWDP